MCNISNSCCIDSKSFKGTGRILFTSIEVSVVSCWKSEPCKLWLQKTRFTMEAAFPTVNECVNHFLKKMKLNTSIQKTKTKKEKKKIT